MKSDDTPVVTRMASWADVPAHLLKPADPGVSYPEYLDAREVIRGAEVTKPRAESILADLIALGWRKVAEPESLSGGARNRDTLHAATVNLSPAETDTARTYLFGYLMGSASADEFEVAVSAALAFVERCRT